MMSNKTKISYNSYKIALKKFTTHVTEIAKSFGREEVNFADFGQILTEVGLFRAILHEKKNEAVYSKPKVKRNSEVAKESLVIKRSTEKRRKEEIHFYEQGWMMLNPNNLEAIPVEHVIDLLKVLFCPLKNDQKEVLSLIAEYVGPRMGLKEEEERKSPINDKNVKLWSINKLVEEFYKLKANEIAYRDIWHLKENMQKFKENQEKLLPFEPNPEKNRSRSNTNFVRDRLPILMNIYEKKKETKIAIFQQREDEEVEACTFIPKITKRKMERRNSEKNIVNF